MVSAHAMADHSKTPDVSVIVAAQNVGPYIAAALRSALDQRDVNVEVIVVDDASSDDTAEIVAAMATTDPRVVLIRRTTAGGPSIARQAAIAVASAPWLAILDGDDLIAPDRCRALLDLADATSADVVADNFQRFRVEGDESSATMIPRAEAPYTFFVDAASFISGNIIYGRPNLDFRAVKPLFRTAFMTANAIRYRDDLPIGEDYHICLACLQAGGRFVVTSESFYKYRVRDGSQSFRLRAEHIDQLLKAHEDCGIEQSALGSKQLTSISQVYVRALERARSFTQFVDQLKSHQVGKAMSSMLLTPDAWPLVIRFGFEAMAKRVRRLA